MNFTNSKKDTLLANAARECDVTLTWVWELVIHNCISTRADWWGVYVNLDEFKEYIRSHRHEANKNMVQHKKRLRAK
jgi:hypothetical protein